MNEYLLTHNDNIILCCFLTDWQTTFKKGSTQSSSHTLQKYSSFKDK